MLSAPYLNSSREITTVDTKRPGVKSHCYSTSVIQGILSGSWQETEPITHGLPAFIMQLIIITSLTRFFILLLRPLRQPKIVAEIIAGTLMGPSTLGRLKRKCPFFMSVFDVATVMTLETVGYIGLIYFLFLLGLEIEVSTLLKVSRKAFAIALAGTILPFFIGLALYYVYLPQVGPAFQLGSVFWGVALSVTGLPVVAEVLANLKILHTEIGKTALSSALVNEFFSWTLLTTTTALSTNKRRAYLSLSCTVGFIVFSFFVIRPAIIWMIRRTQRGRYYSEETICLVLTGVLACGLITDLVGVNSLVGAFVFGLVIPTGLLGPKFLDVLKGFVEDLLMPIFFTLSGYRSSFDGFSGILHWYTVGAVILVACVCKLVSTIFISLFYGMPLREGLALGILMNTKGLLALIVINMGRDHLVLEDNTFTVMLISILAMTMATQPLISILYQRTKHLHHHKHRLIQRLKPDVEFRILACVHEPHSVAGIVTLLEASHPSRRSPISVFALQLVQLTGHTTALLIAHGPTRSGSQSSNGGKVNQILEAFEKFEEECSGVSVQPLTAMSPYGTMHEDICSIAEDKRVTLIILPYHKKQTIHNKLEEMNHAYKDINDNVLLNAPCSVAILVDRGFWASVETDAERSTTRHIAMIYIGGPNDREALSYARRMAGHPNATLTVVRLVERNPEGIVKLADRLQEIIQAPTEVSEAQTELMLDESFIKEFCHKVSSNRSVVYLEKAVSNGAETIQTIKAMSQGFDLFVVGKGAGDSSPLTSGICDWDDEPSELGTIGDLLVTSGFSSTISVLVVQQYSGGRTAGEGAATAADGSNVNEFEVERRSS